MQQRTEISPCASSFSIVPLVSTNMTTVNTTTNMRFVGMCTLLNEFFATREFRDFEVYIAALDFGQFFKGLHGKSLNLIFVTEFSRFHEICKIRKCRKCAKFVFRIELIILSSAVIVCATEVPVHVTSALFTQVR